MALNFGTQNNTEISNNQRNQNTGVKMNLAKTVQAGERINLSKQVGSSVTKYAVGMNWNPKPGITADCDISIVLLDESGNAIQGSNGANMPKCMCYYGQLEISGVKSYGDNQTGDDSEVKTPTNSDEQVDVDFSMLESNAKQVLIIATTHSEENGQPGQPIPFGRVAAPTLVVYNNTDKNNPIPLYEFEMDEDASVATAVEVAKFYNKNGQWRYTSMLDEVGRDPFGLNSIVEKYSIG